MPFCQRGFCHLAQLSKIGDEKHPVGIRNYNTHYFKFCKLLSWPTQAFIVEIWTIRSRFITSSPITAYWGPCVSSINLWLLKVQVKARWGYHTKRKCEVGRNERSSFFSTILILVQSLFMYYSNLLIYTTYALLSHFSTCLRAYRLGISIPQPCVNFHRGQVA